MDDLRTLFNGICMFFVSSFLWHVEAFCKNTDHRIVGEPILTLKECGNIGAVSRITSSKECLGACEVEMELK